MISLFLSLLGEKSSLDQMLLSQVTYATFDNKQKMYLEKPLFWKGVCMEH